MRTLVSIALLFAALISSSIQASPLDDAKEAGDVIEWRDGYVRAHGNVPSAIEALVKSVNQRRNEAYAKIAKKNGISAKQVGEESYLRRHKQ